MLIKFMQLKSKNASKGEN